MTPYNIMGIGISIIIMVAVLPTALSILFNVNTAGWSTGAVALWDALPLVILASLILAYYAVQKYM